ncbi:MAG: PTS sugar transporter subunit IIA [Kiritimatiellae bacterium]|nr:PTS sugar transporter subunit IIA [Kiritimatiellia bacterium]
MNFAECLQNSCITLDIKGETKSEIITELVDLLDVAGKITDRAAVLKAVFDREEQVSTGLQLGVAMPHGKTVALREMIVAVGLKKGGVDFDSLDGKPSNIFIMTVSSVLNANEHIEFLGAMSSMLTHSAIRKAVLNSQSSQELIDVLKGDE